MSKNRGSAIIDYENGIILIKRILKEDLGFKGLDILYDIVLNWINNPYMLFISAGSNDTLIWSTPAGYHDTLNKNGVTHIWHYVTGGDHGGKTIRPHMYNFIRHVFKAS